MWAKNVPDDEIRDILHLRPEEWRHLMKVMKEMDETEGDNHIAFAKFKAKTMKRAKELERMRLYAEGNEELPTAVKCFQLEAEGDRSLIEMGQKLGVLKGEVVETTINVKKDIRLSALFAHLTVEEASAAEADMRKLTQALLAEGISLNDTGTGSGNKS